MAGNAKANIAILKAGAALAASAVLSVLVVNGSPWASIAMQGDHSLIELPSTDESSDDGEQNVPQQKLDGMSLGSRGLQASHSATDEGRAGEPAELPATASLPSLEHSNIEAGPALQSASPRSGMVVTTEVDDDRIITDEVVTIESARAIDAKVLTLGEAVDTQGSADIISGYVLGEDGVSQDMKHAWDSVQQARSENGLIAAPRLSDETFSAAASSIGYVAQGEDPNLVRRIGADIGALGHDEILGVYDLAAADLGHIDGVLMRLQGVIAPTADDTCLTAAGTSYDCAEWARDGLSKILDGRDLACEVLDIPGGQDGAREGWCNLTLRNGAVRDVGELAIAAGLVRAGHVAEMRSPYWAAEKQARADRVGIWSGTFNPAADEKGN